MQAARGLVGVRFRLHGRDPATGLDCIGLVAVSLRKIGVSPDIPVGYALRNSSISSWLTLASRSGLKMADLPIEPGDVLLSKPGPQQHHIMIAETTSSAIHAHAGLRRVVCQPLDAGISLAAHWRLIE